MAPDRAPGLVLRHGVDGPPGILGEWLAERAIPYRVHETWREPLPAEPSEFGWIASLGSEHTPGDPKAPAWVAEEVGFLGRALGDRVPVMGLCFGGQALALAAGGEVGAANPPEVGWLEVESADPALIPAGPWLHYHYDQLSPPPGAQVLARSPSGPAAFGLDGSLGLQFHPESTPAIAARWAAQDQRLAEVGTTPEELAGQGAGAAGAAGESARRLFDAWWTECVHYPEEDQS
jgi:GMP synthase-like glutamine amidotransferase